MKKTPSQKPLRLDRSTIARLDRAAMPEIAGGREPTSSLVQCGPTQRPTCGC
jgi:hypothetical protein